MRIRNLTYSNFKGHSGSFDLGPVTLITGRNFSHKTSIPLAIRLAMAGKLPPPLGTKRIYDLAGNPEGPGQMSIWLTMDTGREVGWAWKRDAAGRVKTDGGLGADIAMPELMLDPRLFFAKTAAEQVQTIFSVCDVDDFNPDEIKAGLQSIQIAPVVTCQTTLAEIAKFLEFPSVRFQPGDPNWKVPAWFDHVLDWLKAEAKKAGEEAKTTAGALKAFVVDVDPCEDVSAELAAARTKLARMQVGNPAQLQAELDSMVWRLQDYGALEKYKADICKLEAELKDADPDEIQAEIDDLAPKVHDFEQRAAGGEVKAKFFKEEYDKLAASEHCPVCSSKSGKWKENGLVLLSTQMGQAIQEGRSATDQLDRLSALVARKQQFEQLAMLRREQSEVTALLSNIIETEARLKSAGELNTEGIRETTENIARLEAEQRRYDVWATDLKRRELFEETLRESQCRADVFKAVIAKVQAVQERLVGKAFTQVLNVAKHFTNGLLNSPLEFVDGELGRRVAKTDQDAGCEAPVGSWIGFHVFSGTEEALALAGFSVALTGDAPVKLVILDELGRLDAQRKVDVAMRMLTLVDAGVIDQAILIDVEARAYAGLAARPGFKVIECKPGKPLTAMPVT